ncbi:phage tail fiber domain-containing protein [Chromobacterium haemolyticum]|uniref:phage tail fiber domain-containing protein n=1 Tax=Chromobacterium TaxID=535 RepID=UPI004056E752
MTIPNLNVSPNRNDTKSFQTWIADGTTTVYPFSIDYLRKSFMHVEVDGTRLTPGTKPGEGDWWFSQDTEITLAAPATEGALITLKRLTPSDRIIEFIDGSILKSVDLNVSALQTLHISEEARDYMVNTVGVDDEGNIDFRYKRGVRVGDPKDPLDAINLRVYKDDADGAYKSRVAAEAARDAAKASEAAAKGSEGAAKASEVAAKASEDNAKIQRDEASKSETNARASAEAAKASQEGAAASAAAAKVSEDNAEKWAQEVAGQNVEEAIKAHNGDVSSHPDKLSIASFREVVLPDGNIKGTLWQDGFINLHIEHRARELSTVEIRKQIAEDGNVMGPLWRDGYLSTHIELRSREIAKEEVAAVSRTSRWRLVFDSGINNTTGGNFSENVIGKWLVVHQSQLPMSPPMYIYGDGAYYYTHQQFTVAGRANSIRITNGGASFSALGADGNSGVYYGLAIYAFDY